MASGHDLYPLILDSFVKVVIPAKAGILSPANHLKKNWIPVFTGMTKKGRLRTFYECINFDFCILHSAFCIHQTFVP